MAYLVMHCFLHSLTQSLKQLLGTYHVDVYECGRLDSSCAYLLI
jgi:hypothetical protein